MRSEFVGVWSEMWREVWLPLIDQPLREGEDSVPEDIFLRAVPRGRQGAQGAAIDRSARRRHRRPG